MSQVDQLRIRAYNVEFGDAFLITFYEKDADENPVPRNILFDVGNVYETRPGSSNKLFMPVVDDILSALDGRPLDLYVMTHEHLDHTQGLLYYEKHGVEAGHLKEKLDTQYSWLTASSESNYYDKHKDAKKLKTKNREIIEEVLSYLEASSGTGVDADPVVKILTQINNPQRTADCVQYLRELAKNTYYIYRGFDTIGKHPFTEVELEILAPEENTYEYYKHTNLLPMHLEKETTGATISFPNLQPPPGVDAGSFYNLLAYRRSDVENLLMIDKAENNTSVVLSLRWRGLSFLFTGDAEQDSWKKMKKLKILKPVQFLKVAHHGSSNGTPDSDVLNQVLPLSDPDGKKRCVVVSTWTDISTGEEVYPGVPCERTLQLTKSHCNEYIEVYKRNPTDGGYVDIIFDDNGWAETKPSDS
ncbi:MAG: hypothetical protein NTY03_04565 [Candidatus Bathyarchaeota archaeon]|nr:hypothetical protein [Candidatus Bathyarchaeota archaeon]